MSDRDSYDALDTPAIINLLINSESPPNVHMGAIATLSGRSEPSRTQGFISALQSMVQHAGSYDGQVMAATVDALATNPDASVTEAMIDALSGVLGAVVDGKDILAPDFREHFYDVLLSRQSDDDLEAWGEKLPQLGGKALAGAVLDPVAAQLVEAIDPRTMLEGLAEPDRTAGLISVITGAMQGRGSLDAVRWAVPLVRKSNDPAQLEQGLEQLEQLWEQAHKAGREKLVANLEAILKALDRRPRTTMERLAGKRPWAN